MKALSIHALVCAAAFASALVVACQARANDRAPDRLASTQGKVEVRITDGPASDFMGFQICQLVPKGPHSKVGAGQHGRGAQLHQA
jgi:hypothetical protein